LLALAGGALMLAALAARAFSSSAVEPHPPQ